MRILCFTNAAKKWTTKSFEFLRECQPWCEMQQVKKGAQNAKKVARNTPLYTFRFLHFASIFAYFALSV